MSWTARVWFVLCLVALPTCATAATIHVPGGHPTIQAGIDAASFGDTVLVACGTYYEHNIEMESGICLTSETGQADCVTIDAQREGRVLSCYGLDKGTMVVGLTLTNGDIQASNGGGISCRYSLVTFVNCVVSRNRAVGYRCRGGGMYCIGSNAPTLVNCVFTDNTADRTGGVDCDFCAPTFTECLFTNNVTLTTSSFGGGMSCRSSASSPTLIDCTFYGNTSPEDGGGMFCAGGASPTLVGCKFSNNTAARFGGGVFWDCTFSGNSAEARGGGMSFELGSLEVLENCLFQANSSPMGAGVCCYESSPSFEGCTFVLNEAGIGGGIAFVESGYAELTSCTVSDNSAVLGGGMYCVSSTVILENCIVAFSETGEAIFCLDACSLDLTCCDAYGNEGGDWVGCIADQYGVNGNFSLDPLFCGDLSDEKPFALHDASPCAAANNPGCGQVGAWGVACGATPVEATSWGAIKGLFR